MSDKKKAELAPGTPRVSRIVAGIFVALVVVALLVPFVGMLWAPTTQTSENRELAAFPSLTNDDGSANVNILSELGDWFEDHWAYRSQVIDADAHLEAALGESAVADVVVGRDGWLYYTPSTYEYLGTTELSDQKIYNIAYNVKQMQTYVEGLGKKFVFTIAPDKASLYPEHLPQNYIEVPDEHTRTLLMQYLEELDVNYVDMFKLFSSQEKRLYWKRDSHWNNEGALLAYNALMDAIGRKHDTLAEVVPVQTNDYVGDLASMLYPANPGGESTVSYDDALSWEYTEGESPEDDWVEAKSTRKGASGTALFYRDSFGNNLLPFVANEYATTYFSKLIPYDLVQAETLDVDAVVVERVERHLAYLAESPAMFAACELDAKVGKVKDVRAGDASSMALSESGIYAVCSGTLDEASVAKYGCDDVVLEVKLKGGESKRYVASRVSGDEGDWGYTAYLDADELAKAKSVKLELQSGKKLYELANMNL